jgi:hypothetical protein
MWSADLLEPAPEHLQIILYVCRNSAAYLPPGMIFNTYRVSAKLHKESMFYSITLWRKPIVCIFAWRMTNNGAK